MWIKSRTNKDIGPQFNTLAYKHTPSHDGVIFVRMIDHTHIHRITSVILTSDRCSIGEILKYLPVEIGGSTNFAAYCHNDGNKIVFNLQKMENWKVGLQFIIDFVGTHMVPFPNSVKHSIHLFYSSLDYLNLAMEEKIGENEIEQAMYLISGTVKLSNRHLLPIPDESIRILIRNGYCREAYDFCDNGGDIYTHLKVEIMDQLLYLHSEGKYILSDEEIEQYKKERFYCVMETGNTREKKITLNDIRGLGWNDDVIPGANIDTETIFILAEKERKQRDENGLLKKKNSRVREGVKE